MKKGFTLIELLAVIVILAIIALIVTPTISKVIKGAKDSAARQSVVNYVSAIDTAAQAELLKSPNNPMINNFEYNVTIDRFDVDASGNKPTAGAVNLINNKVYSGTLCIDNYIIEYSKGKAEIISEEGCELNHRYHTVDYYDSNVGEPGTQSEPGPNWKRYNKFTRLNNKSIYVELCTNVAGKENCIGSSKRISMNEVVSDNNGLLSTNYCTLLSASRIQELEESGTYRVEGFTCTDGTETYEYVYKERKGIDDSVFTPSRIIEQIAYKKYGANAKSSCSSKVKYFTEKDIRSDILPYLDLAPAEIDNLDAPEFLKLQNYFQSVSGIMTMADTGESISITAYDVNNISKSIGKGVVEDYWCGSGS